MKDIIEAAWEDRSLLEQESTQNTIRQVIEQLDLGKLRVASRVEIILTTKDCGEITRH